MVPPPEVDTNPAAAVALPVPSILKTDVLSCQHPPERPATMLCVTKWRIKKWKDNEWSIRRPKNKNSKGLQNLLWRRNFLPSWPSGSTLRKKMRLLNRLHAHKFSFRNLLQILSNQNISYLKVRKLFPHFATLASEMEHLQIYELTQS